MKNKVLTGILLIFFLIALFFASFVLFNKYNETYSYDQVTSGIIDGLNYKDLKTEEVEDILFFVAEDLKDKKDLKVMVFERDFLFKSRYRKKYEEEKSDVISSIYYGTDKSGYILVFGRNTEENPIDSFEVVSEKTKKVDVKEKGIILEVMRGKAKDVKNLRIEYNQKEQEKTN
ncbi:hypothetical protein [Lagierella massiliensis]|uniref:hypothetical protein n=1 Tax=Lagierella massiliensis TaxID=1689303 RepID=UPI0006D84493|nr:hypothetical protein [Lagierella massiliensis]